MACDFFSVDSSGSPATTYCSSSRSSLAGCSCAVSRPTRPAQWVTQQARNLAADTGGRAASSFAISIRDRDTKFTRAFDDVWRSIGAQMIRTPVRAPNANAFAERWVGTVRRECLDHLLIVGPRHLARVLAVYVGHYNPHRPHRGLGLVAPDPRPIPNVTRPLTADRIRRHDVLGGLIHEYIAVAA